MSFLYRIFSDFCLKSCVLQLDDGTYNCQRCGKSRSKPVKTLCITSLPKILVIHIKRFEHVRIILKDFFLADFTRTIHKPTNLLHEIYDCRVVFDETCFFYEITFSHLSTVICYGLGPLPCALAARTTLHTHTHTHTHTLHFSVKTLHEYFAQHFAINSIAFLSKPCISSEGREVPCDRLKL